MAVPDTSPESAPSGFTVTIRRLVADTTVVVQPPGGTPWWVPLVIGLGLALVAAAASYTATWLFKKRDGEREIALRAVDLIDRAEKMASSDDRLDAEGGLTELELLLQHARVRAQPLGSDGLDERFWVALVHLNSMSSPYGLMSSPSGPEDRSRARRWLYRAIANVREGLVPFLAPPRFLPHQRAIELPRSFPTYDDYQEMIQGEQSLLDALDDWRDGRWPQPSDDQRSFVVPAPSVKGDNAG